MTASATDFATYAEYAAVRAAEGFQVIPEALFNSLKAGAAEPKQGDTFEKDGQSYRWVRNAMTGKLVAELADTPFACSVASEAYFCS